MIEGQNNALSGRDSFHIPATPKGLLSVTALVLAIDRIGTDPAKKLVREYLKCDQHRIRQTALNAISLHRDAEAKLQLMDMLQTGRFANKRIAAEALGRIGDKSVVPALLQAAGDADDRFLEHSIIYAIIELNDIPATEEGIKSENARTRRAALIALDQMPGGGLKSEQVVPLLASKNNVDLDTANWLLKHHSEWGDDLAGWLTEQFSRLPKDADAQEFDVLESQLATFTGTPSIQQLLAKAAGQPGKSLAARRLALRVMAGAKLKELPPLWADTLAKLLDANSPVIKDTVAAARALPGPKVPHPELCGALREAAASEKLEDLVRLNALAAIPAGLPDLNDYEWELLVQGLKSDNAISVRSAAADILSKATLNEQELLVLCDVIKTVGPLELDRVLAPFDKSTNADVGLKLLASLKVATALTSLRIDSLRQKLAKYSPAVIQGIDEVEKLVNVDAATQRARIEELLKHVGTGDVRRGQSVFNSTRAACIVCHKFGYVGGTTGPDLTRIGGIRQERDLLESILYPSLSFVRSYEPVVISTHDGKVFNGLIRNETAGEIVLATGPNKEERIRKSDIDDTKPSTVSIMPAGLDKQLTPQDLLDLVAFLKNAK